MSRTPYSGIWDCITRMMRLEGPGAFYKAYTTTVLAAGRSQLLLDRHALGRPHPAWLRRCTCALRCLPCCMVSICRERAGLQAG